MDFIAEDGYEVKPGMEEAYRQWLIDHAEELRRSMPPGTEYLGTYVLTMGNDYEGGTWRDLTRVDSYGAFDRFAEANKDPDGEFGRLTREIAQFIDYSRSPQRWTHLLFKNVVDATIINTPEAETKELVAAGR